MLKQLCVAISKEFVLTKFEGSQAKAGRQKQNGIRNEIENLVLF